MRTMWTSVNGFLPRCARTTRRTAWRAASSIRPSSLRSDGAEIGQHLAQPRDDGLGKRAVLVFDAAQRHLGRRHRAALAVDHQRRGGGAIPQQLAPLAQ